MDRMAVANLAVGIVSALAAGIAAYYAKSSPSKQDLERVEMNTARSAEHIALVERHLGEQNERDAITRLADTVGISVTGELANESPMVLTLRVDDPRVYITQIRLTNQIGMLAGTFQCVSSDHECVFTATIDAISVSGWFNSSEFAGGRRMASIRAFINVQGREAERTFRVDILTFNRNRTSDPNKVEAVMAVSGKC